MKRERRDVPAETLRQPEAGGADLARRLTEVRQLRPAETHWLAEWEAGRDAVLAAAENGGELEPQPPPTAACRDCWIQGRDAALEALTREAAP